MNQIPNIEEEKTVIEESYHYWRECHKCGHAGNYYLHCLHDENQSTCIKCGEKLPSIPQDCDCEFATTETELHQQLQKAREEERERIITILDDYEIDGEWQRNEMLRKIIADIAEINYTDLGKSSL